MGTKSNSSGERTCKKNTSHHWSQGLLVAMKDPNCIVLEDELIVVIKDAYPKAKFHYLVCPKEDIASLKQVNSKHLNLLKHMHQIGIQLSSKNKESNFLIGYHSVPSMVRLHLHVISDDFDSPYLKTKKHWNSFTTEFFMPSEKVIESLETKGKINHPKVSEAKSFINHPLKCHKCEYKPKHMPDLKHHIKEHFTS